MKKFKFVLMALIFGLHSLYAADDWGKIGHRVTGEIAQKYLTKKTQRAINELLNGQSLAFVANYADDIKSDKEYRSYGPWHYVNFPFNSTYEQHPKSEKDDLIMGIKTCISVLKNENASKDEKIFHLKMLVHFIGDLHQPLHIGLADDKGGNDFQVRWFKEGTNLHRVWDYHMIDDYGMSYTELAENSEELTKNELKQFRAGTITDWMYDSRDLCKKVYANTEIGDKLGYRYMYDYMNVVRAQLQKGGIRLAILLNDIFG